MFTNRLTQASATKNTSYNETFAKMKGERRVLLTEIASYYVNKQLRHLLNIIDECYLNAKHAQ